MDPGIGCVVPTDAPAFGVAEHHHLQRRYQSLGDDFFLRLRWLTVHHFLGQLRHDISGDQIS